MMAARVHSDVLGSGAGRSVVLDQHLIDRLPAVRGELVAMAPLAPQTWFRVGGPAEVLFRPADADDLAAFLAALPAEIPVTPIGLASNLLVRDGGVPGVVIKLGNTFAQVSIDGDVITAGAGAPDRKVANQARAAGLAGLEFLTGVPGRIGGAVKMNAGAYGQEVKDGLIAAEVIDRTGQRQWRRADALGFSYRHSILADDDIVIATRFRGQRDDPAAIAARMSDITARRAATQPVQSKTGGSTFANPAADLRAWQLVDQVGGRGLRVGGAAVSTLHSNFIVNTGAATAADVEALGELLRARVEAAQGITLRWEVARIGLAASTPPANPEGGTT